MNVFVDKRIYFVYTDIDVYPSYILWRRKHMARLGQTATTKTNGYVIQTNVRRWGNSQGIRLTKEIMTQMNLQENDTVAINVYDGKMTVEKINKPKYLNLTERLESFYKRPIDEIYVESTQEVDVGDPKGSEIW